MFVLNTREGPADLWSCNPRDLGISTLCSIEKWKWGKSLFKWSYKNRINLSNFRRIYSGETMPRIFLKHMLRSIKGEVKIDISCDILYVPIFGISKFVIWHHLSLFLYELLYFIEIENRKLCYTKFNEQNVF